MDTLFLFSMLLNAALLIHAYTRWKQYNEKVDAFKKNLEELSKPHKKQESYEVKDLLRDLLSGEALVQVKRIDPADVFLRSPRGDR